MANPQSNVTPISVSIGDGAKMIGVSKSRFYQLIAAGDIPSFKLGFRHLIRTADLNAYIDRLAA